MDTADLNRRFMDRTEADRPMRPDRPTVTITTTAAGIADLVNDVGLYLSSAFSSAAGYVSPVHWPGADRMAAELVAKVLDAASDAGGPPVVLVRLAIGHGVPPGTYDVELPLDGSPATVELGGPLLSLHRPHVGILSRVDRGEALMDENVELRRRVMHLESELIKARSAR